MYVIIVIIVMFGCNIMMQEFPLLQNPILKAQIFKYKTFLNLYF